MMDLYRAGGPFMLPLTVLAIAVVLVTVKKTLDVMVKKEQPAAQHRTLVNAVLQLGLLSFFMGVLSQAIGLIQAFQAIEAAGDVSPALLAGGLKVSMIAPVYGLIILIASFVFWSLLRYRCEALELA